MPGLSMSAPDLPAMPRAAGLLRTSLALRLALAAALLVLVAGALAGWLVARAADQQSLQRLLLQQTDATEMVARMLASKIEQHQKALRTVAAGITPDMLDSPLLVQALLQQSLPAVQLFDFVQVAGQDGQLRANLRHGRFAPPASLEPAERDGLRRTLVQGKPLVSELIAGRTEDARVMLTMPLHHADGSVMGVVSGGMPLQSPALLPASMALPERDGARLVVFTRDGTILLHSDAARTMGQVRDEPGLATVYQQWLQQQAPVEEHGSTRVLAQHVVSVAGMPLPQWQVARVSDARTVLTPLHSTQRPALWLAAASVALLALLAALGGLWMGSPLARLRERADQLLRHPGEAGAVPPWPPHPGIGTGTGMGMGTDFGMGLLDTDEVGALARTLEAAEALLLRQGAQLRTVQNQLSAVLELAGVGIVVLRHGCLETVGRHACQMLGYSAAELRGIRVNDLYRSSADYLQTRARMRASFAAHGVLAGEVRLQRKDGSAVWLRVQGRHVVVGERESGTLWLLQDLAASHGARQQHSWISTHDALTQLSNRSGCEQRLQALLAERRAPGAQRAGGTGPGAAGRGAAVSAAAISASAAHAGPEGVLLHLDLDLFAVINDTAGQAAGDDVLCYVAQLLQAQVGHSGWVARLGDDKYAVLLPGCSAPHARGVAEQLRLAVQGWEPVYQGRSFALSASIGLVVLDAHVQDAGAALQAADMACYRAKRAGRNRVEVHVPAPAAPAAPGPVLPSALPGG